MNKLNILSLLKNTSGVLIGVGLHHYGGARSVLDRKEVKLESENQAVRDEMLTKISEGVEKLVKKTEELDNSINIPINDVENIKNVLNGMKEASEVKDGSGLENGLKVLNQIIDGWYKGNNYIPDSSFFTWLNGVDIIKYLDSLSLLQESSFIHLCMFIYILCCVYTLISVFFGNEIIKYFNLEEKYPKLSIFFKLRMKFQRYYLIWNLLGITIMCILGIGINLLVLFYK